MSGRARRSRLNKLVKGDSCPFRGYSFVAMNINNSFAPKGQSSWLLAQAHRIKKSSATSVEDFFYYKIHAPVTR